MSSTVFGINAQIDIGNFAVGIGTFCVALVSAIAIRRQGKSRVAEFRKEWIENLRLQLAEFQLNLTNMALISGHYWRAKKAKHEADIKKYQLEFFESAKKSQYLKNYISMMVNPKENGHSVLERCIQVAHRRALHKFKEGKELDDGEASDLPSLIDQSRLVLKYEWDRVKNS